MLGPLATPPSVLAGDPHTHLSSDPMWNLLAGAKARELDTKEAPAGPVPSRPSGHTVLQALVFAPPASGSHQQPKTGIRGKPSGCKTWGEEGSRNAVLSRTEGHHPMLKTH